MAKKIIKFQISHDAYEYIKQQAEEHNLSLSHEIRRALRTYYNKNFKIN